MAGEIVSVIGELELRDDFNKSIGGAIEGLGKLGDEAKNLSGPFDIFEASTIESFQSVGAAVAIVTGALAAIGAGVVALAAQGADVLDVASTFEHFAGSATAAAEDLTALRDGVQGTVSDFDLSKEAARILSAQVKLSADDFGTLGSAAMMLQNRGLGPTSDMLAMISDAMITGRTRALAMKLGVIDLGDAHENFAKTLGVEASQLSDAGKAEANRLQVMKMLTSAVDDAGESQLDFGEKVDRAWAQLENWTNQLAVAVTSSPVLTTLVDILGETFAAAFSTDKKDLIGSIVSAIESGIIVTTNIGIATVEAARVIYTAWKAAEVVITTFETILAKVFATITSGVATVIELAAALPGATDGMKNVALTAREMADGLDLAAEGLNLQRKEAAEAVHGHSEFQTALDQTGGFLFALKDRLVEAKNAHKVNTDAVVEATTTTKKHGEAIEQNSGRFIDNAAVAKASAAALKGFNDAMIELMSAGTDLDDTLDTINGSVLEAIKYYMQAGVAQGSLATAYALTATQMKAVANALKQEQEQLKIETQSIQETTEAWREVFVLRESRGATATQEHILQINAAFDAEVEKIQYVRGNYEEHYAALSALRDEQLKDALVDSDELRKHSRDGLQEIADRARATFEAAASDSNNFSSEYIAHLADMVIETQSAADNFGMSFNDAFTAITTAASTAAKQTVATWSQAMDAVRAGQGQLTGTLSVGGPFQGTKEQITNSYQQGRYYGPIDEHGAPDWSKILLQGKAAGGPVEGANPYIVGEHGPELFIPRQSGSIVPNNQMNSSPINITIHVNGTAQDVARKVMTEIERTMKAERRWPSS